MTRGHRRQAGFTLTEMVIGLALGSIMALALAGTFLVGYRTISQEARAIAADTALGAASLPLLRDLSSATTITATATPLAPGSGSLSLSFGSTGASTSVTYTIDANANLIRTVNSTTNSVAARGIKALSISSTGCKWTVTLTPSATSAAAQTLQVSQRTQGCF